MNFFRAISNLLRFDRTNWKALALCVFAGTIFWAFNALNKNYATNLKFPLHFEFDDSTYIAVDPLPGSVALNVTGSGWDLLRKSLGVKVPIILMPLDRPADTRKIVASTLSTIIASQIGVLKINYIVTDTLRFRIEPTATKRIKLLADIRNVTYKKNFGRTSPIVVLPDSVTLGGPKSLIANLPDTLILTVTGTRFDSNLRENVEVIVSNNDLISRNPPVAEVMFEVGAVEEIIRYLKLKSPTTPWGTEVDRDTVRAIFLIPVKERERFKSESIHVTLPSNITELSKGETKAFVPMAKGVPDYARLILVDSVRVKKY
ncbi:hypothetical protein BH10BAC4_BH10BAC4_09640 [soil metagenome]